MRGLEFARKEVVLGCALWCVCVHLHHGSNLQTGICVWRCGCEVCILGPNGATLGAHLTYRVCPKPALRDRHMLIQPRGSCLSLLVVWGPFLRASSVGMAFWGILIYSLTGSEVLKGFQAFHALDQSPTMKIRCLGIPSKRFVGF